MRRARAKMSSLGKKQFGEAGKTNGIHEKTMANKDVSVKKTPENGPLEKKRKAPVPTASTSDRFYSPLVKNIAKEEQISLYELEQIEGSGKEGRVTKNDILDYLKERQQQKNSDAHSGAPFSRPSEITDEDEVIVMDRVRKIIADRMVESRRISAHVHSFVEADVTNIVNWREKVKADFEESLGEKLTYSPIFMEAVVKASKIIQW